MARRTMLSFERVAQQNGLVTAEQVRECQTVQEEARLRGEEPPSIEQVMLKKGFLREDQTRAVQTALARMLRDEERGEQPLRIGAYEVIKKIGDGGLGTVYRARQLSMSRDVALKVLHKKWLTDEEFKKRFLLEARLAGKLSHQNLIQVFEVGKDRGTYFFSMEFVDGQTLDDLIEREGPVPLPRALDIALQVLRAIQYLRSHDLVHRDIKPGNVMINRAGQVKLGDFGFVYSKLDKMIAPEGEVLGTPDYISPEQALGLDTIDWRSDQYSLGCTLYHMVTKRPPFEGSQSAILRQHVKTELPDPRTFNPGLGEAFVQVLERMLAKDPNERYQSTDELFRDLEGLRAGSSGSSGPVEVGKSTVMRAFKLEQERLLKTTQELEGLRVQLAETRRHAIYAFIAAGVMLVLLVAVAVWALLRE